MLDSNENSVEENKNDDEPVERLTLDKTPNFYSSPHTDNNWHSYLIASLLHFYTAMVRLVLENVCLVWHSGLTAGQFNAIENIQKRALRMIYSDGDYEIASIVARIDSFKKRLKYWWRDSLRGRS